MPKFCTQCGAQLNDDAVFCTTCGAKITDAEKPTAENAPITEEVNEPVQTEVSEEATDNVIADTPEEPQPTAEETPLDKGLAFAKDKVGETYEAFRKSPNRDKYIGFAAIGIVVIVVLCVVLSLIFGGGYKGAVKDYMKFVSEGEYDNFVDATPDIIVEAVLEKEYDGDEDDMEDALDKFEWASLITKFDYEILDAEKFDSDQLDGLEEYLQDEYEKYVDDDIKVSKAYEVKVKTTSKIKGYGKETERQYLIVAKVNGDWGVVDSSSNSQIDDYE